MSKSWLGLGHLLEEVQKKIEIPSPLHTSILELIQMNEIGSNRTPSRPILFCGTLRATRQYVLG